MKTLAAWRRSMGRRVARLRTNRARLAAALGGLALLAGCGAAPESPPRVRLVIAPAVAAEAMAALDMWQAALPDYQPEVVISDECPEAGAGGEVWCIASAAEIPCGPNDDGTPNDSCAGTTAPSAGGTEWRMPMGLPSIPALVKPGHVWVRSYLTSADQTGTLTHELGHTLGVAHLATGVMRAQRSEVDRAATRYIDPLALDAARAARAEQ